jgi:hypothetical protein
MHTTPAPGISVRREGSHVCIEDYDVENGRAVLMRVSLLDAETAVRIGHALVRLGTEASREGHQ